MVHKSPDSQEKNPLLLWWYHSEWIADIGFWLTTLDNATTCYSILMLIFTWWKCTFWLFYDTVKWKI